MLPESTSPVRTSRARARPSSPTTKTVALSPSGFRIAVLGTTSAIRRLISRAYPYPLFEAQTRIGHPNIGAEGPRGGIDRRIHFRHGALEQLARKGVGAHLARHPEIDVTHLVLGQRGIHIDRVHDAELHQRFVHLAHLARI